MSKRLKRRILDICGLNNLSREEKVHKASAILADSDYKQKVCNQIMGASHRDVEKVLKAILVIKLSKEDEEIAELEMDCPDKLDPPTQMTRKKKLIKMVPLMDQREVTWLINATNKPLEGESKTSDNYSIYSQDEISELINK